jgi:1-acyl-sn-glycerol-3-phosphate acyltransferase
MRRTWISGFAQGSFVSFGTIPILRLALYGFSRKTRKSGHGPTLTATGGVVAMLHRLDYIWRLFGTGLSFAIFGLGSLILTVFIFPLVAITSPNESLRKSRIQQLIHYVFRFYVGILTFLRVIEFNTEGRERLLGCRGKLIIANHPSLLDVVLLLSIMPRAQCVVKHQLWNSRILGGVMRAAGYIRNDLDSEALIAQCQDVLREEENIILFPEGTRSQPGRPLKFKRGFANIATLTGADLQLVTITCRPTTLTKGEHWYQIPEQRAKFDLSVHNQIDVKEYTRREPRPLAARRLTRDLEQYYVGKLSVG